MKIRASLKTFLLVVTMFLMLVVLFWDVLIPETSEEVPSMAPGDYSYSIYFAENRINYLMKTYHLPCFAFAMVDDQKVVFQAVKGFQDLQNGIRASDGTLFRAGSISKVFTGLEIMRLYEEGRLEIDLPLSVYIPYFSIQSRFKDAGPVTIRKILAHRSGLPRNGCLLPWHMDGYPEVLEDVVRSLKYAFMAYPPGYRYKYSNVGFDLLGHVIERKRKKLFAEYMDNDVLPDIGMDQSTFLAVSDDLGRIARGYSYSNGSYFPYGQYERSQLASANLHSNIPDMCNFLKFLFRDGMGVRGQIIKKETLEMMYQPQFSWPGDPNENGLAWRTDTHRLSELAVFHHGILLGNQSLIALLPERKVGIVLFCTSSSMDDSLLMEFGFQVLALMVETKFGVISQPEGESKELESVKLPSGKEQYGGKYCLEDELFDLYVKSKDLKLQIAPGQMDMIPLGGRRFSLSSDQVILKRFSDLEVEFFMDEVKRDWVIHIFREGVYLGTAIKCPILKDNETEKWKKLEGEYEAYPRFASRFTGNKKFGKAEIVIREGVLSFPSHRAVLMPLNDNELVILGGLFDGETILYDPMTGYLTWQDVVYYKAD